MRKTINTTYCDIDLINEWWGVFKPKFFNWIDFHLIDIHVEFDRQHGVFEFEFILLGLGFRLYWVYDGKANNKSFKKYEALLNDETTEWLKL